MKKYDKAWAGTLLLGMLLPIAALAQGLPGGASTLNETHGDWTVACAASEGVARCAMSQTQLGSENRQRVLAVELQATAGGERASGRLVLPFGLRLDDGVSLTVDEAAPFQSPRFSTCLPVGCLVPLEFDAGAVSAMRAGSKLTVQASANDTGQEIGFSISLSGFTSALNRIVELND